MPSKRGQKSIQVGFTELLGSLLLQRGEATVLALLAAAALIAMLPSVGSGGGNTNSDIPGRGAPSKLDLNAASWCELELLPGIGEGRAREIVAYREKAGPYLKVEDLANVPGITSTTIERLFPYLDVKPR